MNLVIDQGNTVCKLAICSPHSVDRSYVLRRLRWQDLERLLGRCPEIGSAIYSSVSMVDEELLSGLQARLSGLVVQMDATTPVPLTLEYDRSTLGSDRIAAVVGATSLVGVGRELLVIDAGTAITYEYVDAMGVYRGGNISLGMGLRAKALHQFTSRLPLVEPEGGVVGYGRCTQEALELGIARGLAYEIDGYIAELRRQSSTAEVLLTGGDALRVAPLLQMKEVKTVRNLVLQGLNIILEYNK